MILIHGECGSGKSAVLRALETAPPAGFRAVYVPVPTLDFPGLARWCLDRLGIDAGDDAVAELRVAAKRMRLLVLIDDADRLPLDAALAARHLERDSEGAVTLVAACGSDEIRNPAIVALGAPGHAIALAPGKIEDAAAAVRDRLAPAPARVPNAAAATLRPGPAPAPLRTPRAALAEPTPVGAELPRATAPMAPQTRPAPAPTPQAQLASRPLVQSSPPARTVPLSLAVAISIAAFAIPVAFIAGYFLGGTRAQKPASAPVAASAPELPAVASAPPASSEAAPQQLAKSAVREAPPLEIAPRIEVAASAAPVALPRAPALARVQAEPSAVPRAAPRAESPRGALTPPAATRRRPEPRAESSVSEAWDAPALISVEPGNSAP